METIRMAGRALRACAALGLVAAPWAHATDTTLQGLKTLDICRVDATTWKYSGVVSLWNPGAYDTTGFALKDCIQSRVGSAPFADAPGLCATSIQPLSPTPVPIVIPKATTQGSAVSFGYTITGQPLVGDVRNAATATITNYVGHRGTPYGIQVTAPWAGGTPPSCSPVAGCTATVGYWGRKPGVVWPQPYLRSASFYLSGQTWQVALTTPPAASPGYYQLAHQFIAATLNSAKGAGVPAGVQTVLTQSDAWLATHGPASCTTASACGTQKAWAAVLDLYNNGRYPGGPRHCD